MRVRFFAAAAVVFVLGFCPAALATPVATSDSAYTVMGRVFPDPLANCQHLATKPCSPNAQGNTPAFQFIQYQELIDGLKYMNQKADWKKYMEVWPLDGYLGDGSGSGLGSDAFPGNNLSKLEFNPKQEYQSAGLPTTTLDRKHSDLIVVRVTDESVPDTNKKRYALSLSIHGIERAGVEGGTRAIEDLVTAQTTGLAGKPVVPADVQAGAPSFADVLKKTIIYFTYPNPDGWRRGSITDGGVFFQRYNGNGVDVNRDWPDIGFSFRPYSGLSEPESRAFSSFYQNVKQQTGAKFTAGDDLHGMPFADALSYTLLPHGKHDYGKDLRIREAAKTIHRASEKALLWSPIIQPNSAPKGGGAPCVPDVAVGEACAQIYGQTWGTVYDTINYTTTGALGDWFDSSIGMGADGIDNEMAFSHLDKNINFDPHTEQLHVDGNKALIYAHLAAMNAPATGNFQAGAGRKGYLPNPRFIRKQKAFQPPNGVPNTQPQADIAGRSGTIDVDGNIVFPFVVQYRPPTATEQGIYNGGMRVDITNQNAQGIASGMATLKVQCRFCDHHVGTQEDDDWVTVQEDFNQSPLYFQAGLTASVNQPQAYAAGGKPVEWRAVVNGPTALAKMSIDFTAGAASTDGGTGGDMPPIVGGYSVANTDFFSDLNKFIPDANNRMVPFSARNLIEGKQDIPGLKYFVLADEALPGYTGPYGEDQPRPTGPRTADKTFSSGVTVPGQGNRIEGTYETHEFTVGPNDANGSMNVKIAWDVPANDFDLYLYWKDADGTLSPVAKSADAPPETDEQVTVQNPAPGTYVALVENFGAAVPTYRGSVTFTPASSSSGTPSGTATGAYTQAEKRKWFNILKTFLNRGGTLVLTDGAIRALPEFTRIPADAIQRQTVYAGQIAFADTDANDPTLDEPLAKDIAQDGARFGSGYRRQMFEPTPLGFSIQDGAGSNESHARQWDVDKAYFRAAGGRVAGSSIDSGAGDAEAVYGRVTLGEIRYGQGKIRIAGSLLPQPTEDFDHTLGLEPYAETYTSYILWRNLLNP